MCSIFGYLRRHINGSVMDVHAKNIWHKGSFRGRDGSGLCGLRYDDDTLQRLSNTKLVDFSAIPCSVIIGNHRAEPTTEYVKHKHGYDQQPYTVGDWTIVHNGTIANDKELRTGQHDTSIDSVAIAEFLDEQFENNLPLREATRRFGKLLSSYLKGSYAILAINPKYPDSIFYIANYRPIWFVKTNDEVVFGSSRHQCLCTDIPAQMIAPYSYGSFKLDDKDISRYHFSFEAIANEKVLMVCSGGLDSTVAAAALISEGYDVTLMHFTYGSRAEGKEIQCVKAIADYLKVPLKIFPMPVYDKEDSPLLDSESTVAGGEAGAEFAYEWVPARNLVMLSIATAYAEAKGFSYIGLGNNLEEAGAYPDNEPEFIDRMNDIMPFAVGDGKRVQILMPVGNMMKHEIVAKGLEVSAPMHLTWSCYRNGQHHCGTCGPCHMRKIAFKINADKHPGLKDSVEYEK